MPGSTASERALCTKCRKPVSSSAMAARCPHCGTLNSSKSQAPAKRTGAARRTSARGTPQPTSWHDQDTLEIAGNNPAPLPTPEPAPKATAPAAPPLKKLGHYEVVEELGRGGMGLVLRGRDPLLRREVAIKILRPEAQSDAQRRLRFTEEAQVTGQLEHPGIVPVHYLGQDAEGRAYFSMKLVTGQPLDQLISKWHQGDRETREEFPRGRLLSIFERVCETVGFAHAKGVLHRDLKPANVMIGAHGEVWVLDWGLAKAIKARDASGTLKTRAQEISSVREDLGKDLTLDGLTVGTPEYMCPEQAAGDPLDEGADIFGLGGVLYAMLTGQAPVRGKSVEDTVSNAAHGKFMPVRRTEAGRHLPAALVAIVEKCLAKQRKDRYRSTAGLLRDLRAFSAGEAVSALPDTALDRFRRFTRKHRTGMAVAGTLTGLVLLILTVASVLVARKERESRAAQETAQQDRQHALEAEARRNEAEAKQLQAELQKQKVLAASAEQANRRLRAFEPYQAAMDLLLRGQLPARAAELARRAVDMDPDFPEARFALGEALRLSGSPLEAAQAYLRADELSRKLAQRPNLQAIVAAGFAYDGAGYYKEAEDAFRRAELHGANDPLAQVGRIFRLAHYRKLLEARKLADETLLAAPHLWETHFSVGFVIREMVEDGYLPRSELSGSAIPRLRKSIELAPRQAEPMVWLALLVGNESPEEATRPADRAVELEPANGSRYVTRASMRGKLGNARGAAEDLETARRLKANPALLLQMEATRMARARDFSGAYEALGKVLREHWEWPPLVANYLNLGHSLGKVQDDAPLYERWRQANPDYPAVRAYSAALEYGRGNIEAALKELDAGLSIAPYAENLHRLKANLLLASRRYDAALEACETAQKRLPADASIAAIRFQSLFALKRKAEALQYLETLERDYPTHKEIWASLRSAIEKAAKSNP